MRDVATSKPKARTTAYRAGIRTAEVISAKSADVRRYRRELAAANLPGWACARILAALRSGTSLRDAAADLYISTAAVYGRARWDPEFREALDGALEEWSRPRMSHMCGTPTGYRHYGCRCRRCRRAHAEEVGRYRTLE